MSGEPREIKRLRIRTYPDEVLKRPGEPVGPEKFDEDLARLAESMARAMHDEAGAGLAAPQVGVSIRLVVMDLSPRQDSGIVLVNPVIVDSSGRDVAEEGCLSVPEVTADVGRRERVTVEYETLGGEKTGFEAEGLLARIVQHELDHLNGMLFIDRLGPAGRLAVRTALSELEAGAAK